MLLPSLECIKEINPFYFVLDVYNITEDDDIRWMIYQLLIDAQRGVFTIDSASIGKEENLLSVTIRKGHRTWERKFETDAFKNLNTNF